MPLHALALALAFSLSCASLGEREARLYRSGLEARRAERWREAIQLFSRVLETSPADRDSLLNRGISRYHVRDLDGAESDLQAVVEWLPDAETRHEALYYLARARIDRARQLLTEPDADHDASKEERDAALNAALQNLQEANVIRQTYETRLWSGYCYASLQSYDAALREAERCERIQPDRLEHHVIQAMTYERASGHGTVPRRSSRIYLELLERDASRSVHLLYEHLSVVFEKLAAEDRPRVLAHLEAYVALHADRNPGVAAMVERTVASRQDSQLRGQVTQILDRASVLESSGDYEQALQILEDNESFLPHSEELAVIRARLREAWSSQLEAEARTELEQPRPRHVEASLRKLRQARELTSNPLHRAAIHQAIDTYRGAFLSLPGDERILAAQALIREGDYQKALAVLGRVRRDDPSLRHALNYLMGYAHLQMTNWREAVVFLEKLPRGHFLNQQLYLGIALWKSGSRQNGIELLRDIPLKARSGDALRIVALRARQLEDFDEAIRNLEALVEPTREDLIVLRETLMTRGEQHAAEGDWGGALEKWRHARRITESKLKQRDPGVYLRIGEAYFRLDDHARARKIFRDLLSYSLSEEEEVRYRKAYLYRGLLHFSADDEVKAFADLEKFRSLGGEFPPDLRPTYDVLLGLRGDFVPLEKISSWEYSTGDGSPPTQMRIVDERETGKHRVEIRKGTRSVVETWWLDGPFWHREGASARETIPCRLRSRGAEPTSYEESLPDGSYRARIVAAGVLVAVSSTRSYPGCLKVEIRREIHSPTQIVLESTLYLAPGVGVVKREDFTDGFKTSEQILTRIVER